jgi:hypothetical protein
VLGDFSAERGDAVSVARLPLWVIHVISSVRKRLPLITHLRTYRCVAAPLGDQPADPRRGPPHGGELRLAAEMVEVYGQ